MQIYELKFFFFLFARKHTVTYNNKLDSTYALTLCTILQLGYSFAGPLTHHSQHSLTHLMLSCTHSQKIQSHTRTSHIYIK